MRLKTKTNVGTRPVRLTSHGRHLVTTILKLILRKTFSLQQRRIHSVEDKIILRPGKIEQAQPVDMALVLWRQRHAVNGRLDVAPGQKAQRIARVDRQAAVERLGPLPRAGRVVLDLQGGDRLSKEQGDGAQVGVPGRPQPVGQLRLFVLAELAVFHVSQVRLVMHVPFVDLGEEVLGQLEGDGNQVVEWVQNLVVEVLVIMSVG